MRGDHVAGRGATPNPARENRWQNSAGLAATEALDPIRRLLDLLDTALARRGAITLPDGRAVLVRPVTDGCYAVERRP